MTTYLAALVARLDVEYLRLFLTASVLGLCVSVVLLAACLLVYYLGTEQRFHRTLWMIGEVQLALVVYYMVDYDGDHELKVLLGLAGGLTAEAVALVRLLRRTIREHAIRTGRAEPC